MDLSSDFPHVLDAAQRGDEGAFLALFRATQPRLLRYLAVVAGPLAEDIASETWVSVVRDLGNFAGDEVHAFHAWVLNIARRRWVDEVRRRSRRPEAPTAEVPEQPSVADPAEEVANSDATVRILEFVTQLPPDQAEVVTLRVVMGMDVNETAAAMGKKPGTVRVLAHRALRRLAVLLDSAGWDPAAAGVTDRPRQAISHRERD